MEDPNLRKLLVSIDELRGADRDRALRDALGVSSIDTSALPPSENTLAFRALAAAIEGVIREQPSSLGLDWEAENSL